LGSAAPREDAVPVDHSQANGVAKAEVGSRFIDFSAFNTQGEEVRLSAHVGKAIVALQFWGLRCSPCLAEMAFLAELQRKFEGRIQVLGINTDRVAHQALRQAMVARRIEVAYPIVADPAFDISQHYTQWLIPLTVLIDRKGTVRAILTGYSEQMKSELQAELAKLMGA
jgi:cytochrome c biogenesis protein CcmG/thiol:disulfide interchange protein DsbE